MFRDALRYPFRTDGDRSALDVVLIGGGLHLLAAFVPVVPLVPVAGYLVRVLDHAARTDRPTFRDDASPPSFGGVRSLFADGLAAAAIVVAYLSVPLVVLVVTARGVGLAAVGAGGPNPAVGVGFLAGSTVTILLALAFAYPLPAALTAYARTRSLRAAFEADRLRAALTDARYFVAVGAGLLWLGIAVVLAGPLNRLALGFFVVFYAEVVAAVLWGRAVNDRSGG
ncbi:DUF4013 domain-containing protein [Halorussus salinisoli]|uniref:DUF4013 domain-containing protein n=1 Tax=Halorussus salinisoli TaxID=2558242 RepID=UPI0010C19F91|nr:DUF4013 domain-containing protein [Halorussus salinisoli]